MDEFVSILILTHNAPQFVDETLSTVAALTSSVRYEVIVVDNNSGAETHDVVDAHYRRGTIQKLKKLDYNSLFSPGNNIASQMASDKASHFLLLNSDVQVRNAFWLRHLLDIHRRGISSYGWVKAALGKVDGYCLLVDADLYRHHRLDENHQWWFAVTKLQAILLREGHSVQGYEHHDPIIYHHGGKSGDGHKGAKGMDVTEAESASWFGSLRPVNLGAAPASIAPIAATTP